MPVQSAGSVFAICSSSSSPLSVLYDALFDGIDKYNIEHFGCTKEELTANRVPQRIMF